ncbi:MAG: MEDS domain-containing protein [Candidatus Thorarchaeota archaeon]
MQTERDSTDLLTDFGLTPYQAKVYLAAVKLGPAAAGKIAKVAGVRREEVYRTLPKLEKAGLVERILGRPIKVRALPIEDALSILVKRKEEAARKELADLESKKENLIESLETELESIEVEEEASQFVLVSEKETVSKRMETLIEESIDVIDLVDTVENVVRFLLAYEDSILKSVKNKVHLRILTECPQEEDTVPRLLTKMIPKANISLRYVDDIPGRYVLFDRNKVMLATSAKGGLTDTKFLLSQDANLVSLIKRDFEEQFRRSVDWKSYEATDAGNLGRTLKHLRPRDHVVLFYDNCELKHEVLFNYIKSGLEQGEATKYVCSEQTSDEIRNAMKKFGIAVETHERTGALQVLDYTDVYIIDGNFSIDDVMETWERFHTESRALGFSGMRVTGEMACFFKHGLIEELMDYEKALHTVLDIPITAICAYSTTILEKVDKPINIYSELVKAHGKVLFAAEDNPIGRIEVRV